MINLLKVLWIAFPRFWILLFQRCKVFSCEEFKPDSWFINPESQIQLTWESQGVLFYSLQFNDQKFYLPHWTKAITLKGQALQANYVLTAYSFSFKQIKQDAYVYLLSSTIKESKLNRDTFWESVNTYDKLESNKVLSLNNQKALISNEFRNVELPINQIDRFVQTKTQIKLIDRINQINVIKLKNPSI